MMTTGTSVQRTQRCSLSALAIKINALRISGTEKPPQIVINCQCHLLTCRSSKSATILHTLPQIVRSLRRIHWKSYRWSVHGTCRNRQVQNEMNAQIGPSLTEVTAFVVVDVDVLRRRIGIYSCLIREKPSSYADKLEKEDFWKSICNTLFCPATVRVATPAPPTVRRIRRV